MSLLSSRVYNTRQVGIVIPHLKQRKEKPRDSVSRSEFPRETVAGPGPEPGLSLEPCCPAPSLPLLLFIAGPKPWLQ